MEVFNENLLRISKPTEKVLANEKRNKRKSKIFKSEENDENYDYNNCPSKSLRGNLEFREEDYKIQNNHKFTMELFENLSVEDKEENLIKRILRELENKSPNISEYNSVLSKDKMLYSKKFNETKTSCNKIYKV